jgi:hypothetical protein
MLQTAHTAAIATNITLSLSNPIRRIKSGRKDGRRMWGVWYIKATHAGFWWENLKQIGHLEGLEVDGYVILK